MGQPGSTLHSQPSIPSLSAPDWQAHDVWGIILFFSIWVWVLLFLAAFFLCFIFLFLFLGVFLLFLKAFVVYYSLPPPPGGTAAEA